MNNRLSSAAAIMLMLCGSAAAANAPDVTSSVVVSAAPSDPAPTSTQVAAIPPTPIAADPKDELICKNEPPPTGRRTGGQRVCATKKQWDLIATDAQKWVRERQNGAVANQGVPGNSP